MGNGNGSTERAASFSYNGPKHHFHSVLRRWRLWVAVVAGSIAIMTALGSAVVWGGNQIWHTKEEARVHENEMGDRVEEIKETLETVQGQITTMQSQMVSFIQESRRARLEDRLAQTEMDIQRFERQIAQDGSGARTNDVTQLQRLKSKRDQIKRELDQLYRRERFE